MVLLDPKLRPREGRTFEQIPHLLFHSGARSFPGFVFSIRTAGVVEQAPDRRYDDCMGGRMAALLRAVAPDGVWLGGGVGPESIAEARAAAIYREKGQLAQDATRPAPVARRQALTASCRLTGAASVASTPQRSLPHRSRDHGRRADRRLFRRDRRHLDRRHHSARPRTEEVGCIDQVAVRRGRQQSVSPNSGRVIRGSNSLANSFGPCTIIEMLDSLLYETFGDATLGQSSARLVIPAFLGPHTSSPS